MEEIILLTLMFLLLTTIYCFNKIYEKKGLIYSIVLLSIISYILSFKITNIFHSNINLGIVTILGIFTAIYIYLIKYGKKEYKSILNITFISNIIFGLLIILLNYIIPSITDNISLDMKEVFINNFKIIISFPIIMYISELCIEKLFTLLKKIETNVFLSVILTYIITSIIYTIIFYLISYINILSIKEALFLGVSTYIIGLIITIINAIFIYLLTKKKVKK